MTKRCKNRKHIADVNTITIDELDEIISTHTSSNTRNKETESDSTIGNAEECSNMIDTCCNSSLDDLTYEAFRKMMDVKMTEQRKKFYR